MKKEVQESYQVLKKGKLLLYPTDTVWGIGCDATNPKAVQKIYDLKKREESKALICLVSDFDMLRNYVAFLPDNLENIIQQQTKPTTVIYHSSKNLASNLIAEDNSIAIRVCKTDFCQALFKKFKKPIVSTSANISGTPTPKTYEQINAEIKKGVDYIVNLQTDKKNAQPSNIIKIEKDGSIQVIRD